jgi:hypothetical protein
LEEFSASSSEAVPYADAFWASALALSAEGCVAFC